MTHTIRQRIQTAYDQSKLSAIGLFQSLIDISSTEGWDPTLAILEGLVIERRLGWWDRFKPGFISSGNLIRDAYHVFYETYLGLSLPRDGEIVTATEQRWVMRWWNTCPTLEACQQFELNTCEICKKVYERPVQALFTCIDPRLRFGRNYSALRPQAPYCEEIIDLED